MIQGRNGGMLRNGGPNSGGPGRPASAIRERLRGSFDERITVLEELADNPKVSPADRARCIDLMGRYGVGALAEVSVDTVRSRVEQTLEAIRAMLPSEDAQRLINRLQPIWTA